MGLAPTECRQQHENGQQQEAICGGCQLAPESRRFRVYGVWWMFRVWGLGLEFRGLGVWGFRVLGSRVWGLGYVDLLSHLLFHPPSNSCISHM